MKMASGSPTPATNLKKRSEQIARVILQDAEREELAPGDPLALEPQMAALYESGRASIREALRILEVYGLVVIEKGRGNGPRLERLKARSVAATLRLYLQVRHATYGDVMDARMAIDPQLARRAAERALREEKKQLRSQLQLIRECDDYTEIGGLVHHFSALVGTTSHNPCLALLSQGLSDIQSWHTHWWFEDADYWEPERKRLNALMSAIEQSDADQAESIVRKRIAAETRLARRIFPQVLTERVYWD
jgi:GntR family transcriptional regulator, transcriptional repressor for pyruvate dehydrogenase complex